MPSREAISPTSSAEKQADEEETRGERTPAPGLASARRGGKGGGRAASSPNGGSLPPPLPASCGRDDPPAPKKGASKVWGGGARVRSKLHVAP